MTVISAYAHGGGTPQLTNEQAGPYLISVWTQPEPLRAGESHISVAVMLPESPGDDGASSDDFQRMVTDATVTVEFSRAMSPQAQPNEMQDALVAAVAVPQSAPISVYYEADVELPAEGEWLVTIQVQGKDGQGTVTFENTVLPKRQINWGLLLTGSLLIFGIFVWLGVKARHRVEKTSKWPDRASVPPLDNS